MTDYAKKTVADLTEILKSRGLPHTGKKADLVARLTEADKAASTTSATAPPPAASPAAEPPATEIPPPSATSTAVPTAPAPPAPATTTHQTDNTTTESSAAITAPTDAPTDAPTPDTALAAATYKLDLPTSSVDEELEKRKARAARFGTTPASTTTDSTTEKDTEAQRALERAKRFGTTGEKSAMGKLDEALPMTREKKGERKRGADDSGLKGRGGGGGGKRSRGGGGGGGERGRERRGNSAASRSGEKPVGVVKVQPAFVSEKDRAAAEARKKKFGA